MGSKGEGFLKRVFLGSTAADLIRITSKPVLLEKYKELEDETECKAICERKFAKILFPTDFSQPAERTFKKIKEFKSITDEIILVHVIDKGVTEEDTALLRKEAKEKLEIMKKQLDELGIKTEIRIRTGVPSENIIKIAEDDAVSLIVIASRGEGIIKELLLGSTAENVARKSTRPVLLFPEKK